MANNSNTNNLPSFVPEWAKPVVIAAAQKYNIPSAVLASLLQQESGYNTHAVSPAGAQGIAQFMPGTAQGYGINPFNPNQAIDAAAHYLRNAMDQFGGSVPMALAAYNAGSGAVQKYGGIPPYAETQNYVRNIMAMSGQSGAQPQGQAAPPPQQQQQGVGQIPPTQINNPMGAAPMPNMGQVAGGRSTQPMPQGQQPVPSAVAQQTANTQGMPRRSFSFAPVQTAGMSNMSGASAGPGPQQQQQQPPISAASIIANAQTPTLPNVGGGSAQAGNQSGIQVPPSSILQYLLGQQGGNTA